MERIFHDVEQNTDEWYDLRVGKITSSNFGTIMANYGKAFGDPAKKYAMRLALESITNFRVETFSNKFMDRGHEFEPAARMQYEDDTMTQVKDGGFMEYGRYGDSIDGLVGNGGIEIKSVIYSTHFDRFLKENYDTSYQWQIVGHIWLHNLSWCDSVSYCPEFPTKNNLHIFRIDRDDEKIDKLQSRLDDFVDLVDEYTEKIR